MSSIKYEGLPRKVLSLSKYALSPKMKTNSNKKGLRGDLYFITSGYLPILNKASTPYYETYGASDEWLSP